MGEVTFLKEFSLMRKQTFGGCYGDHKLESFSFVRERKHNSPSRKNKKLFN